jgi:hypothetical protein
MLRDDNVDGSNLLVDDGQNLRFLEQGELFLADVDWSATECRQQYTLTDSEADFVYLAIIVEATRAYSKYCSFIELLLRLR